ncbi:MAG: alkaline phosphatase family protein [Clostridia bacterium]|nr:alkaline phosphatase family protein [Clostridia bacterium]
MRYYGHVAVIGVDGMGSFNRQADTPRMDEIFRDGAVTYSALSLDPTISAQNWGAMLLGMDPEVHGLTNGYISEHENTDPALVTVFKKIRDAYPDEALVSCCNWDPINYGIIENGLGVVKTTAGNDDEVCEQILEQLDKKPAFLFVQFDDVDGAGHSGVYGQPRHIAQIEHTDELIGSIYDKYKALGIIDDTLFIVTADHGGFEHGHGGYTDGEKYVFIGAAGRYVPKGEIGPALTKDIAAIVLTALGLDVPEYKEGGFTSQVPSGIFPGIGKDYYRRRAVLRHDRKPTVPFADGLGRIFGKDKVRLCMFFDGDFTDETGKNEFERIGNVKFYSDGVRSSCAEFGATGALKTQSALFGSSFTSAFYVELDPSIPDHIVLLASRRWGEGMYCDPGIAVSLRNHSVKVNVGSGDDAWDMVAAFPADEMKGFMHVCVGYDAEKGEMSLWYDFRRILTQIVPEAFRKSLAGSAPLYIGDDSALAFNKDRRLLVRLDELVIASGAMTEDLAKKLEEFYK